MDVLDVIRAIFYVWLFASLAYWAYRGYNRMTKGRADDLAERATIDAPAGAGSGGGRKAADSKGSRAKGATEAEGPGGAKASSGGRRTMREVLDDQQAAKKPGPEVQSGQLVSSVIKEELAARKAQEQPGQNGTDSPDGPESPESQESPGGDGASGRRGLFAPAPTADDDADEEDVAPAPAVSTLLEGIEMPCDLVPLITADLSPSPHHVVFVTTGHAPAQVGSAIGDELERLGFALRSESDTEVLATRAGDTLRVTLHPDAPRARRGGDGEGELLFPSVPGGSVAVEFRS